jgi:hypothetical protein
MKRRHFITSALGGAASLGILSHQKSFLAAEKLRDERQIYELRAYHSVAGKSLELLEDYLAKAEIPALNRSGIKTIGVFEEIDPKEAASLWVVVPYRSMEEFLQIGQALAKDNEYVRQAKTYSGTTRDKPAFARMDSWLLLAFTGMTQLTPPVAASRKMPRIFEMRTYESFSESKARKKVEMFNAGEIEAMKEVGLEPVFYGEALAGRDLPHLTYMLSGPDREAHKKHFDAFLKHPAWVKLKNDPQYADTVSKITSRFLKPTEYSQV